MYRNECRHIITVVTSVKHLHIDKPSNHEHSARIVLK